MLLELEKCVQSDTIQDDLSALKSSLEERLNLQSYPKGVRPMNLTQNKQTKSHQLVLGKVHWPDTQRVSGQ